MPSTPGEVVTEVDVAGFGIGHGKAGPYLGAKRDGIGDRWQNVGLFAHRGIVVGLDKAHGPPARG